MSRRRLRFAEPAHTAKLYVGRDKPDGGKVSEKDLQRIVDGAARGIGGGASRAAARGVWIEPGKMPIREKSATIELVGSAADSCSKFMDRAQALAARAARIGKQTAVLTVVTCAGGDVDATLVGQDGKVAYSLTRLPASDVKRRR